MGLAYEKLGRYEDALRAHLQAIELNPLRSFPRERLFYCFYRIRENKSVVDELLKRLNELDPDLSGEIQEKLEKGEVAPENSFDNLNQWPAQPYRSFRLYGGKHYKSQ
jgi:tetratricopeptide (TPR) repeat protein